MFDLPPQVQTISRAASSAPTSPDVAIARAWSFALTVADRSPAAWMSGQARPMVRDRCISLAEAMTGAITVAQQLDAYTAPFVLAILDQEARLVLAGAAAEGSVAWCHPVTSASEARAVVAEASQLRAQASRASDWQEPELARRLRHRAEVLEARLVDPLWRTFATRALLGAA